MIAGLTVANSASATPAQADHWDVVHNKDADMCTATSPAGGEVTLGISAEGPDFVFKMWAPDFPKMDRAYHGTLVFKDHGGGPVGIVGSDGMMAISLGRGELATGFAKASEVSLKVEGHRHRVSLAGAAEALDQVARCAKQRTLAEAPEKPPRPIPNAGDWTLYETTPYATGSTCMAHLDDPEVDTMLQYDEQGILELTGGNAIWAFPPQEVPMRISIDGGPDLSFPKPAKLEGHSFTLKVEDPQMIEQLRRARMIDWVFPQGSLRSLVTGLGNALDAVSKCRADTRS
jgi:hypothetical protein